MQQYLKYNPDNLIILIDTDFKYKVAALHNNHQLTIHIIAADMLDSLDPLDLVDLDKDYQYNKYQIKYMKVNMKHIIMHYPEAYHNLKHNNHFNPPYMKVNMKYIIIKYPEAYHNY